MANIRIDSDGVATHLFIDGCELGIGIRELSFCAVAGESATMEFKIDAADFQIKPSQQIEPVKNSIEIMLEEAESYRNAQKEVENSEKV